MADVLALQEQKRAQAAEGHPDLIIVKLAERQHGVVSRKQLLGAGVSDRAIRHRISLRRLRLVYRGVYAVGHRRPSELGLFTAAVLAVGKRAVLSYRSAAALWGLRAQISGPVEVTVPRDGGRSRPGIRIRATGSLHPTEVTSHKGIPCTSPARTLVDLAAVLNPDALRRAVERSQIERRFDSRALDSALARASGRSGTTTLRRLLTQLEDEPPPTRNELESRFLDIVRNASLPSPITNAVIVGHEVDFHWPHARLIVETDGRATHDTRVAFERDRARDLDLEAAGWHVIRFSWRQVTRAPERIGAVLRGRL